MKATIKISLLCLSIGAATWLLIKNNSDTKSAPEQHNKLAEKVSKPTPKKSPQPIENESAPQTNDLATALKSITLPDGSTLPPELEAMMKDAKSKQQEMVKKHFSDKFDAELKSLVAQLNLNPTQEQILRELFDQRLNTIASADPSTSNIAELAAAIRGDNLVQSMKDVLTPEQVDNFEAFQERKKQNQIQSKALLELSKLQQELDLTEEQKDDAYEILVEEGTQKLNAKSDEEVVSDAMMSGSGIPIDREAFGIDAVMQAAQNADGNITEEGFAQAIEESRQQQIDQKVNRFSNILTEDQQQQYRNTFDKTPSNTTLKIIKQ